MNRIKELREKAGLKQTALARQLGVSQGALSGWETGKYNADYEHAKMMCGIFGVTLDYLLGRDELSEDSVVDVKETPAVKDDRREKLIAMYDSLSEENRSKLLELADLYLERQRRR